MANLTSSLTIKLLDNVSGPAGKAADALRNLGASGKDLARLGGGANVDKLTKQLDQLARSSAKLNDLGNARSGLKDAATGFREARRQAQGLAKALDEARAKREALKGAKGKETERTSASIEVKRIEAELRRATSAAAQAKTAFADQAATLRSIKGAAGVKSLSAAEAALKSEVVGTNAALKAQIGLMRRAEASAKRSAARREALGMIAAGAGVVAAHKVGEGAHATLETYREFDKERRFGKVVMGLTDEEQKPLVDQAVHMGATTKYNDVQALEAQRELAARGLKGDQVMGVMPAAVDLGQSLDLRLPDAVKQLEGALFGFKKDISTQAAATASARQTADAQVKAAKVSGMTPEDISQLYKYGATPARLAGVNEQTLLAFGGISKKANMGGDEAGVAFRALMSTAIKPTAGAKTAMLASGLNYKDYQKAPDALPLDPFVQDTAARYGVKLNGASQARLAEVFSNKDTISDPAKFAPAVVDALKATLGGQDAKSLKSIAGGANRYRDASMQGIDVNALLADLMKKLPGNLPLANALFGSKQGGRISNALGDPATLQHMIDEITSHSAGFSEKVSAERMSGFDGAVSRFEGAIKNLETAVGRSWDNGGNGGLLTGIADAAGKLVQSFAELDSKSLQVGSALAGIAAAGAGVVGGLKLVGKLVGLGTGAAALEGSAGALDGAAAALTEAAVKLGAADTAKAAAGAAAGGGVSLGAGGLMILGGAAAGAVLDSVTPGQGPGLVGALTGDEGDQARALRSLREDKAREAAAGALPAPSGWGSRNVSAGAKAGAFSTSYKRDGGLVHDFLHGKETASTTLPMPDNMAAGKAGDLDSLVHKAEEAQAKLQAVGGVEVKPQADSSALDSMTQKAGEAQSKLQEVGGVEVKPQVDSSALDALIRKATEAFSALSRLSSAASSANTAIASVNAGSGRVRQALSDNYTAG